MKKIILNSVAALFLVTANLNAQQMIVDLNTGWDAINYSPLYPGQVDDTWQISKHGGSYGPVYVSTGRDAAFHSQTGTFQDILQSQYDHNVLAPYIDGSNDIIEFPVGTPSGKYIYRMQFDYDACNTVNSAKINITVLAGAGISRILVNGNPKALPVYPPVANYTNTDFLSIYDAWQHSVGGNQGVLPIPAQTINLNPWDIHNGTNSIYVEIDPAIYINNHISLGSLTAAFMVRAYLEINYTPSAPVAQYINLSGSSNVLCGNSGGFLNIDLSAVPNVATYNLGVSNGYFAQAMSYQQIAVNPPSTTNYVVTLTSPGGCVTSVNHLVVRPVAPTLDGTSVICVGGTGNIIINGISPTNNYVQIISSSPGGGKGLVFSGTATGPIYLNPSSTANYNVIITDAYGCITTLPWTINVVQQPCVLPGRLAAIKTTEVLHNDITVSPNPSNGVFKIESSAAGTVEVINTSGVKIKSLEMNGSAAEYELNLTEFSKGVYLLNIYTNGEKFTKRIIVE